MDPESLTRPSASSWWNGRRVFITGCTGFLGSWLIRILSEAGAQVIGLARREPDPGSFFLRIVRHAQPLLCYGAVEDYSLLEQIIAAHAPEVVFHMAGQSKVGLARQHPRATFESNVRGTWNLLEASRLAVRPPRLVFSSSEAVSSETFPELYTAENIPLPALSPYTASKLCSELLGRTYASTYGLQCCILRYSNLYGGGDPDLSRIVPGAILSVLCGVPPVIRSDGQTLRDYLYIEDAVRACVAVAIAMDNPQMIGETFNVCSGSSLSVLSLVEMIIRLIGRSDLSPQILHQTVEKTPAQQMSARKTQERLDWRPYTSLETGLQQTIDWYRKHQQRIAE